MREMNFITPLHRRTSRDYVARVVEADKAECAAVAKQFGRDYWDGDRKFGYGGYAYDGRWAPVARAMIDHYELAPDARILDVGCGKGYLLFELSKLMPEATVVGVDISDYALASARQEIKPCLRHADARSLPFEDRSFDLVLSLGAVHNLYIYDLAKALVEIERVKKTRAYIAMESYRNEREKANLLYWQLTCEAFFSHDEWLWVFNHFGYSGDYEFIYFE